MNREEFTKFWTQATGRILPNDVYYHWVISLETPNAICQFYFNDRTAFVVPRIFIASFEARQERI